VSRYLALRIAAILPVLVVASIISFGLAQLAPGDISLVLLGPYANEADRAKLRQELALDQPIYVQYARWIGRAGGGDLGTSIQMRAPVSRVLLEKFQNTLLLGGISFLLAFGAGLAVGIASALRQGTTVDHLAQLFVTFLSTMPVFWVGLALVYVFAVSLHVLPTGRMGPASGRADLLTSAQYLLLPALTTAFIPFAIIAKSTRAAFVDTMREEFVRVAQAKGLRNRTIRTRHILRVAFPAILYVSGLQFSYLIGGTVVFSEVVFSWPGIGLQMFNAVGARDLPMIQGIVLLAAFVSVMASLTTDLLHLALDPRVAQSRSH
jgi:peptide/nickel transport system permease protein